jgi:hypothetical protein
MKSSWYGKTKYAHNIRGARPCFICAIIFTIIFCSSSKCRGNFSLDAEPKETRGGGGQPSATVNYLLLLRYSLLTLLQGESAEYLQCTDSDLY